ncbi:MAG: hypothetical protein GY929_03605 [Actinomycetia bacterium]|nr:hypothetical protein [Actinomycetes bacterium]
MIKLDLSSFLLQWAAGGLLFTWVTTRRRMVSLGYGWTNRTVYGLMALGAAVIGFRGDTVWVRDLSAAAVVIAVLVAGLESWTRRAAGVSGQNAVAEARTARVAAMTGIERVAQHEDDGAEFRPHLDLAAPILALPGLIAAGVAAGDPAWLSVARLLVGAVFLGAVSDAMLLGHWYLVQPGLGRGPLVELVKWTGGVWPVEVALLLVPTGMVSALNGTIDDGYNGLLGWFWVASAISTGVLVFMTWLAVKERSYSAVMAATGLLYLAILTAFGTDLVARAVLAG